MTEIAPASVWIMGLIGLLVVAFAIGRIALLEIGLHRMAAAMTPVVAIPEVVAGTPAAA